MILTCFVGRSFCHAHKEDKAVAIELYSEGIKELESGISIEIKGIGEAYESAKR